jgi:hypothetical protein
MQSKDSFSGPASTHLCRSASIATTIEDTHQYAGEYLVEPPFADSNRSRAG